MLRDHSPRKTVTNCFAILLHKDARYPDQFKYTQVRLTMIIVLHTLGLSVVNVLGLLLTACSYIGLNFFLRITDATCCKEKLGTLALTSTSGRACTPRRRVTGRTSALTSTMGRA